MATRRSPWPVVAVLTVLVLGAGCAGAPEPDPLPAARGTVPGAAEPASGAVEIALRAAGEPLPDVVGDTVDDARRTLGASGVRTQVVAFDADAAVTEQSPRGGDAPPPDGIVTIWLGIPPDLPPAPPPPSAAPAAAPAVVAEAPVTDEAPVPEEAPLPNHPPDPPDAADTEPPAALAEAVASAADAGDEEAPPPARDPDERASRSQPTGKVLEGPATWYGPGFAGNRTACGGRFDPAELTMASRELPCGTRARVTGPSGRSIEVTVTDWGPAEWTGKRFDLSAAAFAEIANLSAGTIPVTVELLR